MKTTALSFSVKAIALALPLAGAALLAKPAAAEQAYVYGSVGAPVYVAPGFQQDPAWRHRQWDRRAPQVSDVSPSQGDRVSDRGLTRISARIHDIGTGIDPGSIVLRIDGRVVDGPVRFNGDEIRYRENLHPGRHWAELTLRDRAGNTTRRAWHFDVVDHDRAYGYGYGGWR
ncbi:MAG: hypothetical protein HY854_13535 [Burkholderiales bacterium]|nr:hypothetical protein [Burkholderiales bacterium]